MNTPTTAPLRTLIALTILTTAQAAQTQQATLIAKRTQKLASPFLTANAWFTDFDKARAAAKKSNRVIFGYFTRSFAH